MNSELKLDIGFAKLVVGIGCDPDFPEVYIALENNEGCVIQDIAVVRPRGLNENPDITEEDINKTVECLVWADESTEDYTHRFEIKMHEGEF